MSTQSATIGTLNENPLHAGLKRHLAGAGDRCEVAVDGSVIDLVREDGGLVEVQTGGFGPLKRKLARLLKKGHRVELVHPIAERKWLVKEDAEGQMLDRRRSPKRGTLWDLFTPLVSAPHLMTHPGCTLTVLLIEMEERRRHVPGKAWRRKGWVVHQRRLLNILERHTFPSPASLADLLPADLPIPFSTADLADRLPITRSVAQQMAFCLRSMETIDAVGKAGNAILYERMKADYHWA